ncbi:DsbE family thiol:disulfide interchange protein [Bauldia litoralis]|uniref:Cytochrome c biogenesis protein CcmG, thiol:disulfide interchange protein DsbE n=1 Tax=Bauldia litoralis TaxID=665467 RepID=A0A1G6ADL8_9HYPH|nr:DsbE family thiol:disulfide interchange protein [Bauldia litoralis]SDB06416.1 cytochrome c biogenesis protein CcmG, thiol:disulfide interchange protein DsbE [Bauldia litoralis]
MTPTDDKAAPPRRPRLIMLLPLFVFVALAAVFLIRLETGGNPDAIPSALIGRPAPDFDLPPLEGIARPGLARADLEGGVTVVNVFASWCGPCRIEHPQLMELAKDDRFQVVGINYKDQPSNARRFLTDLGNPYALIGVDPNGRAGIDWGLYGVPETFIVDAKGIIRYKHIGPIGVDTLSEVILPEIEKAMQPDG